MLLDPKVPDGKASKTYHEKSAGNCLLTQCLRSFDRDPPLDSRNMGYANGSLVCPIGSNGDNIKLWKLFYSPLQTRS